MLRIAVIIASSGRPAEIARWRGYLLSQSHRPYSVIYSVSTNQDLPDPSDLYPNSVVLIGDKGSCSQRNRALDNLPDRIDVVAFFDDDYVPSSDCLEGISNLFILHEKVVGANGILYADGINSPGLSQIDADAIIERQSFLGKRNRPVILRDLTGLYGCNMVFRASAVRKIRFDERLPLYGWQEDIDFAARVRGDGRLVKTDAFAGVHKGVKSGRTSGLRLGYSQIANPIYLARKGTMPRSYAATIIIKNIVSNHAHLFFPEPWIDRLGRARGNWIALSDFVSCKLDPGRIHQL